MLKENLVYSFDDGGKLDYKLACILKEYGFKATFFIPNKCELGISEIKHIAKWHTIGGHTVSHPSDMKILSDRNLKFQIEHNKKCLEEIVQHNITDFCYPKGRYDERIVQAVKDAGYKSARTTVVLNTDIPDDPFRIKTSAHIYPDRKEYKGEYWLDICKVLFDTAIKKGDKGFFHLWGHSRELELYSMWDEFEELLKYIKERI